MHATFQEVNKLTRFERFTVLSSRLCRRYLTFDDTIPEKPHNKENDFICWHYDHCVNCSVKGINLLNFVTSKLSVKKEKLR